jgi:hypothetical protein
MTLIHPIRRNLIELNAVEKTLTDQWFTDNIDNTTCQTIDHCPIDKWRFLTYLCDHKGLLAHGSSRTDLTELIPVAKQRGDLSEFGNATQIFASPDALWALWFALLNRNMKYGGTANSCARQRDAQGRVYKTYWFAIAHENLTESLPLVDGMIYIVRPDSFLDKNGEEWGSKANVMPLAKLAVSPNDWPFKDAILGFDRDRLGDLLAESAEAFPYFDDALLWKVIPPRYQRQSEA